MSYVQALKQTITYWAPTGDDVFGGTTFTTPVQKFARWEDRMEMIRDKNGQEYMAKTRVFLLEEVSLDGYLYLGKSTVADPRTLGAAYEIRAIHKSPDLRNLRALWSVYL